MFTIQKLPLLVLILFLLLEPPIEALCRHEPRLDHIAITAANIIMALLSLAAWAMLRKNVGERPQAFVRGVYGATMLRLFVCLIGITTYALMNRGHLYKPTLFVIFGIYIVYTAVETAVFSRTAKRA